MGNSYLMSSAFSDYTNDQIVSRQNLQQPQIISQLNFNSHQPSNIESQSRNLFQQRPSTVQHFLRPSSGFQTASSHHTNISNIQQNIQNSSQNPRKSLTSGTANYQSSQLNANSQQNFRKQQANNLNNTFTNQNLSHSIQSEDGGQTSASNFGRSASTRPTTAHIFSKSNRAGKNWNIKINQSNKLQQFHQIKSTASFINQSTRDINDSVSHTMYNKNDTNGSIGNFMLNNSDITLDIQKQLQTRNQTSDFIKQRPLTAAATRSRSIRQKHQPESIFIGNFQSQQTIIQNDYQQSNQSRPQTAQKIAKKRQLTQSASKVHSRQQNLNRTFMDITENGIEYSEDIFKQNYKINLINSVAAANSRNNKNSNSVMSRAQSAMSRKLSNRPQSSLGMINRQSSLAIGQDISSYQAQQNLQKPSILIKHGSAKGNNKSSNYQLHNYSQIQKYSQNVIRDFSPQSLDFKENLNEITSQEIMIGKKISVFTINENQNIQGQFQKLRTIDNLISEAKIGGKDRLKANECQDLLSKTDKNIKLMQYKLSKMVCGGSQIPLLSQSNPSNLDLIESTPIYCRIYTHQREGPLKINIEFRDQNSNKFEAQSSTQQIQGDFKLYISDKSTEPNEQNSIYYFHNQTKIVLQPKKPNNALSKTIQNAKSSTKNKDDLHKFQSPYLYLNFISIRGCSIKVYSKFPREDDENDGKRKIKFTSGAGLSLAKRLQSQLREEIQNKIRDIQDNPNLLIELNQDLKELKQKRRERIFGVCNTNFFTQNMVLAEKYNTYQEEINRKRSQSFERIQLYQKKRENMEVSNIKEKILRMNKWEMIRQQRQLDAQQLEILQEKQLRNAKWINLMNTQIILSTLFESFANKREQVREMQRRENCTSKIQRWFRNKLRGSGLSLEQRGARQIFMCFTMVASIKNEKVEDDAHEVITQFLTNQAEVHDLKKKFIQFHKTVSKIQSQWKERMTLIKYKLDFLGMFWEREKLTMIKYYYSKSKKNKKAKTTYNKLSQIDNYTKEYLLKQYFEKCRLEFTVSFFEQKIAFQAKFNDEINDRLDIMRSQIQEKDQILFSGVKEDEALIDFEDQNSPPRGESHSHATGGKDTKKSKKNQSQERKAQNTDNQALQKHGKQSTFKKGSKIQNQSELLKYKKHSSIIHKENKISDALDSLQQIIFLKYVPKRILMQKIIRRAMNFSKDI
eukprot:403335904